LDTGLKKAAFLFVVAIIGMATSTSIPIKFFVLQLIAGGAKVYHSCQFLKRPFCP
jgi:hypothetical protein